MRELNLVLLAVVALSFVDFGATTKAEDEAGAAINRLLQEKIRKKIFEATNEVKGSLTGHIAVSLKGMAPQLNPNSKKNSKSESADNADNDAAKQPAALLKIKKKRKMKTLTGKGKKIQITKSAHAGSIAKISKAPAPSGAAVHQNKGPRQRKHNEKPGAGLAPSPSDVNNAAMDTQKDQNMGSYGNSVPGKNQASSQQAPSTSSSANQANSQTTQNQMPNQVPLMAPPMQMIALAPANPCMNNACAPAPAPQPQACGPTCDNNCCAVNGGQTPQSVCPASCYLQCFHYCPNRCCRNHKSNENGLKKHKVIKHKTNTDIKNEK